MKKKFVSGKCRRFGAIRQNCLLPQGGKVKKDEITYKNLSKEMKFDISH